MADDPRDDEIDVTVRPPADIAARLIVLAALITRAGLERADPSSDVDVENDEENEPTDPDQERFDLLAWLDTERIGPALTMEERRILRAPVGSLDPEHVESSAWWAESLAALAWAASLAPRPGSVGQLSDPVPLLAALPSTWDDPRPFVAVLRPQVDEDVAIERERAELWLWRLALESERRAVRGRERNALTTVAREAAVEGAAAGLWEEHDGDVLLDGTPVGKVDADRLDLATGVAQARLHALNWVAGFGTDWSDVPLDV
jgi:hypothetical protein